MRPLLSVALLVTAAAIAHAGKSVSFKKHGYKKYGPAFVALTAKGDRLLSSAPFAKKLHIWDAATGKKMLEVKADGCHGVFTLPEGTGGWLQDHTGVAYLLDLATGKEIRRFDTGRRYKWGSRGPRGGEGGAACVAASRDGRYVAIGTGALLASGRAQEHVHVFDARTGTRLLELEAFKGIVNAIAFSGDGKHLFAGSGAVVKHWSLPDGKAQPDLEPDQVWRADAMACNADGTLLAIDALGAVVLFDVAGGSVARHVPVGKNGLVQDLALSHDDALLFVGSKTMNQVWVVDVATGKRKKRFKVDPKGCVGLDLSRDGKWLATGGEKYLKVWNLAEVLK